MSSKTEQLSLETAHVLFMDVVGYSKLLLERQTEYLQRLQEIVRDTHAFRRAYADGQLISLPTGDGMALSFFGDPEAPVRCADEVSRALRDRPEIKLRMGVNSGLVYRLADINANMNIAGGGINIAQRVMDCGDAGHILLSKRVADDIGQLSHWAKYVHDIGEAVVKHGVRLPIFSLYNEEIGNEQMPSKLRSRKALRIVKVGLAIAALILIVGVVSVWYQQLNAEPQKLPNSTVAGTPAAERAFNYFLEPFEKDRVDESERFAGNEQFHNGSSLRLVIIPQHAGAFYLVDKGKGLRGTTVWSVLFPTPENNNGSPWVAANQPLSVIIDFDNYSGDENLSIIWTTAPERSLDAVSSYAAKTGYEIKDSTHIETIVSFLVKHESPMPTVEVDSDKKETTVRGPGSNILVVTRVLKHREF